ncbi:cryptochrome/photolyase family protein [Shewanella sp. 1_MG-2023]|uniref:cryptochrome/photolyase family protein n=1 Tax=unclassified Shewanella TaxID=196818 RepID=UPI0026E20177|nr:MULTISPECIES: cryptochrome/photolyase family protein [unclassified Shewanella]MDO6611313.1 cryptochrome/photolyase family protein [Shewanella sp. 7_MG-2023]MDO6771168.1 cryptochrome/photolyase family protein [Shewanella sp. 2_MG-2023]MDO6795849.1 cryptochrome/photolyase family protein [Shewanella sp. 1_MG-2023]
MIKAKRLRLILGDQLNASHSWFADKHPDTVYLIAELKQEANYTRHHGQKICAFFAAMEQFAQALRQAGHQVLHLTLDDTALYSDALYSDLVELLNRLFIQYGIKQFEYQLPDEYRLREQLRCFCASHAIESLAYESEHFYLSDAELSHDFKASTKHRMEHFYRKMRKRFNLLMEGQEPAGGKWNFDADNRQKLKSNDLPDIPEPLIFENDVSAIIDRITRHNIKIIGRMSSRLLWPVTRQQSIQLLEHFCRHCLIRFGTFQDAMTSKADTLLAQRQWSLYHSRLSFALNSKILSPQRVIDTAIGFYQQSLHGDNPISLAQIEGFVRQILGWREFVRGIYWANMPVYGQLNHLDATRNLPQWFWDANTKMNCQHHAVKQSLDYAYAHHIQRLMVTGNFCLITGINPDEVDDWYLGIYIDAIEWVEMPNTRGMSQFADGGIVGSKAYAASGNYINKMSDYCSSCHYKVNKIDTDDACPLNSLYWHFMDKHQHSFNGNPRTRMVYANWLNKSEADRSRILQHAEKLLDNLDTI